MVKARRLRVAEIDYGLSTWTALNETIAELDHEETCMQLLRAELDGKRRGQFIFRLHSRYNKLRANRERLVLLKACAGKMGSKIKAYPELRRLLAA